MRFGAIDAKQTPPFVQSDGRRAGSDDGSDDESTSGFVSSDSAASPEAAQKVLIETVDRSSPIESCRLRGESVPSDMLQIMLTVRDRVTGQRLKDDNIQGAARTF